MFQYNKDTVCKVLDGPELDFYQSMPDPLKKFTPEFRGKGSLIHCSLFIIFISGIITVQYCEDELGYITLVARPQTICTDDDHSSNEENLSATTDQQATDNNSRKSVQFVSRRAIIKG